MSTLIWLSLILAVVGVSLAAYSFWQSNKVTALLRKFFAETGHDEFGEVLLHHQRQLRRDTESLKILAQRLERLEQESNFLLNQVGLVKYNPFPNDGANLSFSMALLNNNGDGVVVTSLHSREGTRLYSKNIKGFKGEQLMDEEAAAIEKAQKVQFNL